MSVVELKRRVERLSQEGMRLYRRGHFQQATNSFRGALDLERQLPSEGPRLAGHLNNLGRSLLQQGDLDGAEGCHRQALAIMEAEHGVRHANLPVHLNSLALVLRRRGRLQEAVDLYGRALEIDLVTRGRDHPAVAVRLHNLARLLHSAGERKTARHLYEQALIILEKVGAPSAAQAASCAANLSSLLLTIGDADGALRHADLALRLEIGANGSSGPKVAMRLNTMARVFARTGETERAEELCRWALDMLPGGHPWQPTLAANLARLNAGETEPRQVAMGDAGEPG